MTNLVLSEENKRELKNYLVENSNVELISAYLYYVQLKLALDPVIFVRDKTIYKSADEVVRELEEKGELWNETEIKINFGTPSVNERTKKIYICPFTGKVFGDNTHPNPQDAIYDWVSKCPENTERVGGLRVKRFFVSEDPEVIKSYMEKNKPQKEALIKTCYSSALSGKLFSTKRAVIEDFKKNYLKPISLVEVPHQDRFKIEDSFLIFIQDLLKEEKITSFVESLSEHEEFTPFINYWLE
ncbi:MAG: DUF2709 domain-containing protein [Chlamydiales bacterium]